MATIYVAASPVGSDTTGDGTQSRPYATIAKANTIVVNGDTVIVEAGTYNEGVYPTRSDVSYIAASGTRPVIQGDAVNSIGFYISNTAIFRVRVEGFEITGQAERGISFQSGKGINSGHVITNNHIHHVGAAGGIAAYGCYITYGSNTVTNNEVHHIGVESMNESSGIWFGYNHDYVCSGNTVYMVRKEGIRDYFGLRPFFHSNRVFLCWTGIAHNKSMSPLTANNYIYHCLAGLNPKHTNETYEFWGLAGTPGSPGPGIEKARYWHNTVYRSSDNHLWLAVNIDPGVGATTGYMWDVDVRNNIFDGLAGSHIADNPNARQGPQIIDYNIFRPIETFLAPPDLAPDTPVYFYRTGFSFGAAGSTKTFAQTQTDLGWNIHSQSVNPQLNNPDTGDLDYGPGAPGAAGGTTLASQWGNQMGARGLGTANATYALTHPATSIASKTPETSTNRSRRAADELQPVYFQTSSTTNEWVTFDFGSVKSFNVIVWDPWTHGSQSNIKDYLIERSNDNATWTTVKSGTNPDSGGASYKYALSTQSCRYVRFTAITSFGANVIFGDLRFGTLTRAGDPAEPPPTTDTTAPTVALTAPANGASLSGDITITATASDNVGVTKVELLVDGVLLATDTAAPYTTTWTTTSSNAGSRTVTAKAYDAAGNTATASRTITVTTPPPPPPATGGAYWGIRLAPSTTSPGGGDPPVSTATTYYVSATGSDTNNGTSTGTAWQTVSKVNAVTFKPGDIVLFQGGQSFTGPLTPPSSGSSSTAPITFGSYGTGRATITNTGAGHGCLIGARSHLIIDGIDFTGPGAATSTGNGVQLSHATTTRPTNITVRNSTLTGWKRGVSLEFPSAYPATGYDTVLIEDCIAIANRDQGIAAYGYDALFVVGRYPHTNVTVRRVKADNNAGSTVSIGGYPSGDGIVLGGVDVGLITLCRATNNGQSSAEGPVGIWCFDSRAVVIDKCISYSNGTNSSNDGGGFDLDINCVNCTVQYCLAYGNEAYGIMCYQDPDWGVTWTGNTIRWNLFWGNGTVFANFGELFFSGTGLNGVDAHNNTCVANDTGAIHPPTVGVAALAGSTAIRVRNNVFKQTGTAPILKSAGAVTAAQMLFQGNAYDKAGLLEIQWPTTVYTTLAAWRAAFAGQEVAASSNVGLVANTLLTQPSTAPTATDPTVSRTVTGLRPQAGSPLIDAALDLQTLFSLNPGTVDYEGTTLAVPYNIGAIG